MVPGVDTISNLKDTMVLIIQILFEAPEKTVIIVSFKKIIRTYEDRDKLAGRGPRAFFSSKEITKQFRTENIKRFKKKLVCSTI